MDADDLSRFPLLGTRRSGEVQRIDITLPGSSLQETRWPVTSITGTERGPAVFINAGIHGGEYPAIQAVIELAGLLDPRQLRGTVVLMPVVNLPGFWERSMFVCPVDGKNPNRVFPGRSDGSYSEQLAHALMAEFITQANFHIDLHGGDIVEALIPFSIVQRGGTDAHRLSRDLATVFGLPYVLLVDRPVQPASGTATYVAATAAGVPSLIAEAGGIGQLEPEAVTLLRDGVLRVLAHLQMIDAGPERAPQPVQLSSFEWLYTPVAGMFYTRVHVGDNVAEGETVGTIGSLRGDEIAEVRSPVAGKVLFLTTSPAVKESGLVMGLGVE